MTPVKQAQHVLILAREVAADAKIDREKAFAAHRHAVTLDALSAQHEKLCDVDTSEEMDAIEPASKALIEQMRPLDDERVADLRKFIDDEKEAIRLMRQAEDILIEPAFAHLEAVGEIPGIVRTMQKEIVSGKFAHNYRPKLVDLYMRLAA